MIPGHEFMGVIERAAADVTGFPVGTRVVAGAGRWCGTCPPCLQGRTNLCHAYYTYGLNTNGGLAEYVTAPASAAHAVPDGVSLTDAACLPTPWATAWHAVVTVGRLRAGETLLVHAAAGSVGLAAVQIASHLGARVVATVSTREKAAALAKVGVEYVVTAGPVAALETVRSVSGGRGADVVLEYLGPATWPTSMAALRIGGRLVFLGNTTGDAVGFSLADAFHRGLELLGSGGYVPTDMTAALAVFWDGGTALVAGEHDLTGIASAHRQLAERATVGRVLVLP
jgi:NADPH:quinone reductase-like Zn-dependent oxidoreductase